MGGTGGPLGGPLGGAGGVDSPLGTFTRARALAGNDEDLLLEIATLENDKAMALMKLDDELDRLIGAAANTPFFTRLKG